MSRRLIWLETRKCTYEQRGELFPGRRVESRTASVGLHRWFATYPVYREFARRTAGRSTWFSSRSDSSRTRSWFSATPFVLSKAHRRTHKHWQPQPKLRSEFALCCSRTSWREVAELPIECHSAGFSRGWCEGSRAAWQSLGLIWVRRTPSYWSKSKSVQIDTRKSDRKLLERWQYDGFVFICGRLLNHR